jgi:hypothetical protein
MECDEPSPLFVSGEQTKRRASGYRLGPGHVAGIDRFGPPHVAPGGARASARERTDALQPRSLEGSRSTSNEYLD